MRYEFRVVTFTALVALVAVSLDRAGAAQNVPDFQGGWSRLTFGFEKPESGQGPIGRYLNKSNTGGDFNNPNLPPAGAKVVKQRSEMLRKGIDYPNPSLNCLPM